MPTRCVLEEHCRRFTREYDGDKDNVKLRGTVLSGGHELATIPNMVSGSSHQYLETYQNPNAMAKKEIDWLREYHNMVKPRDLIDLAAM